MATNTIHCANEALLIGFKIGVQTSSEVEVKEHSKIIVGGKTQHVLVLADKTDFDDGEFVLTESGLVPKQSQE